MSDGLPESKDWFDDLTFGSTADNVWVEPEVETEQNHFLDSAQGKDVVHKRGMNLHLTKFISVLFEASDTAQYSIINNFIQYFILFAYGKRNIRKDAVDESKLNMSQKEVYNRIREEMKNPIRRQRILNFINQKDITKRLINYFVVHYSLMEREMSYYLDKTSYPFKVIGELNNPQQLEILKRKENGENIVWINFHQEYKNSKNKKGRRNRHAPYRRSISVQGADGNEYSLCELNFYLWLDEIGGFELFYMFESDIRDKKAKYDEDKRIQENQIVVGKKKKRKIVLRNTDGRNYKTHLVQCKTAAPFSIIPATCTFSDYVASLQNKRQEKGELQPLDPPKSNTKVKFSDPKTKVKFSEHTKMIEPFSKRVKGM